MKTKPLLYKVSRSSAYYAPYVPLTIGSIRPYTLIRTVEDIDTTWHTLKIHHTPAAEWVMDLPIGSWRYAANRAFGGWMDYSEYELREDVYSLFILRWS